jgi:hypothetical protein
MEFPIEFFLSMARDPSRWDKDHLQEFTELWAEREFGPEYAKEIAEIVSKYTQYNGRRKPEQLEPDTYSPVNYREAERVASEWKSLAARADLVYKQLPEDKRDAFFELVLYPTKASSIVNELYIAAGKNHLYATQGRVSANDLAQEARALFAEDASLSYQYNHLLARGKWNHMMDQTHIGYTFWNEPPLNAMPAVTEVQPVDGAVMAVTAEGSPFATSRDLGVLTLPAFDAFNRQTQFVYIFNRGTRPFEFSANADQPWIKLSVTSGRVEKNERLLVGIDWAKVSAGENEGTITLTQKGGEEYRIRVRALNPTMPTRDSVQGFVESNHVVSMEAEHFSDNTSVGEVHWEKIPGFGRTLSGMTVFPVTAPSVDLSQAAPTLEYKIYLFESGEFNVEAILAPTLNFVPGRGLRFAVSFDDHPPQMIDALKDKSERSWERAVSDGVRKAASTLHVDTPGYHTLKFRMVDPGVVLEKIVVSQGNLPVSYLGPPESYQGTESLQ